MTGKLLISDFNSIKVRLKRINLDWLSVYCIFQFHKGTIKTHDMMNENNKTKKFQFHKGTIKTYHNR